MTCFPEPAGSEPPATGLSWADFVDRSTSDFARQLRSALNQQLDSLPPAAAASFCHRLHVEPFRRVWFEMFVGEFLQRAGASVEPEPHGANGSRPDWKATFPGGQVVYVEATSPVYNVDWSRVQLNQHRLLDVIDVAVPVGWSYVVEELPSHGPNDPVGEFKGVIRQMFATVPPPPQSAKPYEDRIRVSGSTALGAVSLEMVPVRPKEGYGPMLMGPFVGGRDYSAEAIIRAIRGKRRQARAFPGRVLVAIDMPSHIAVDELDTNLLGPMYARLDPLTHRVDPFPTFEPTGALSRQGQAEFPAVLACRGWNMLGFGPDPILIFHPKFEGSLPQALMDLHRRQVEGGLIRGYPATGPPLLPQHG